MAEKILSVGIDIGTSTTSLVFSHLTVEKTSGDLSMPKTEIIEKEVIYRSSVYFTPLRSNTELDAEKIRQIIESEYRSAGITAAEVETGAVIITGDTARKVNAQNVLEEISKFAGDFVVATAGPSLESILAGKGSGAEQYSVDTIDTIINMDVGGGTTNTATFYDGECIDADCIDVGGRLIRFSPGTMRIEYVFPKIEALANKLGIKAAMGSVLTPNEVMRITDAMADAVIGKIPKRPDNPNYLFLRTEGPEIKTSPRDVDVVSFSGGVGKLVYEPDIADKLQYGDIGVFLADSIKRAIASNGLQLVEAKETISATVIGAGNHSMEVSGATITVTQNEKLPLKNLPVASVDYTPDRTAEEFTADIRQKIDWIQGLESEQNVAFNIRTTVRMGFQQISELAEKIVSAAGELLKKQDLLVIIIRGDYGKVLGQSIAVRMPAGKDVICIDSIDIGKGDYIDIGKPIGVAESLPVVVKTIAFSY